jgi:hypothetical protein
MKTKLHTTRVARLLLLAILMTTTAFFARANFVVDSIEYESLGSSAKVVALLHTNPIEELTIPSRVNNKSVTEISFPWQHTLGKFAPYAVLSLPNQLKTIGDYSFRKTTISTINFNPNLIYIGENAFGETQVIELVFPRKLTTIERYAFYECNNLETIFFPSDSKLNSIGEGAFSGSQIEEVILPDACETIDMWAFQRSSKLRKVVLPINLKNLKYDAFMTEVDTLHVYVNSALLSTANVSSSGFIAKKAVIVHIPMGTLSLFQNSAGWTINTLVEDVSCGNNHVVKIENKTPELGSVAMPDATFYKNDMWLVNDGGQAVIELSPIEGNCSWYCIVNGEDMTPFIDSENKLLLTNVTQDVNVEIGFAPQDAFVPFIIKQTDGGSLTLKVYNNEPLKLNIKADDGWTINSVTLNGKDITRKLDGYGDLTIRKVNGAIVVGTSEVAEADVDDPITAFIAFANQESSISNVEVGENIKVLGMVGGLRIENLAKGQVAKVTDISGRIVKTVTGNGETITLELPSNIYLINSNGVTVKIAI